MNAKLYFVIIEPIDGNDDDLQYNFHVQWNRNGINKTLKIQMKVKLTRSLNIVYTVKLNDPMS